MEVRKEITEGPTGMRRTSTRVYDADRTLHKRVKFEEEE
jgi:hypothetical protein